MNSVRSLATEYGLTIEEVRRACEWARLAKLAANPPTPRRDRAKLKLALPKPKPPTSIWCDQCDARVVIAQAQSCASPWCKAKEA